MMMLPADNELTDDCQLRSDVSAAPAYHTLDKEYNLSTLSLSSANVDNKWVFMWIHQLMFSRTRAMSTTSAISESQ